MPNRCVIYSVNKIGQLAHELLRSATITKNYCVDADFVLYTTPEFADIEKQFGKRVFDRIICVDDKSSKKFEYRIDRYIESFGLGYNRLLFMDTDAMFVDNANDIFDILNQFDIAMAHAPGRIAADNPKVPNSYPEFNCGVIVCRSSDKVKDNFVKWLEMYKKNEINHPHDQGAFRQTMYYSDLRIATLIPEYNNRSTSRDDCKIWHNRDVIYPLYEELFPD